MKDLFSVKDKVVIITGANGGIGNALALGFAKNQSIVHGIVLKVPNTKSPNVFYHKCDISKPKQFAKICETIFKKYKHIDVLINCAGITLPNKKPNKQYPQVNWLKTIEINLTSSFYCIQSVIPYMVKNNQGSIINITSINSESAFPRNPSYLASKGGLKMLGKSFAKDWGARGIRVNNIGPGYIKTNMTRNSFKNKKLRQAIEKHTILNRWGTPDDLIGPAIFLASDSSRYVTGQDIYVDGGWLANGLLID